MIESRMALAGSVALGSGSDSDWGAGAIVGSGAEVVSGPDSGATVAAGATVDEPSPDGSLEEQAASKTAEKAIEVTNRRMPKV
ncbi:MAG: hypothetical protein ACPF97_05230 [Ilumatobacteraceae bacterium]